MDTEQTQVNLLVVNAFDALRIPYFLGGSMASSVHGIYRATADSDFIAAIRPHHAEPLVRLLQPAFYAEVDAIRSAAASSRSFNVIHLETMLKVDVFVAKSDPFHLPLQGAAVEASGTGYLKAVCALPLQPSARRILRFLVTCPCSSFSFAGR